MTDSNRVSAADLYLSTADALGLSPRQRREGLEQIAAADASIRQNMDRELGDDR